MRRCGLVLVLLLLVACGGPTDDDDHEQLGEGFVVAEGTELVGHVVPDAIDGWWALMRVDTDAATAFQRYLTQAVAAGFNKGSEAGYDRFDCDRSASDDRDSDDQHEPTQVTCETQLANVETHQIVNILVQVCKDCGPPLSTAVVQVSQSTFLGEVPGAPVAPTVEVADTPTAELSDDERDESENPPSQLFPLNSSGYRPKTPVLDGSKVVLRSDGFCERGFFAIVSVSGDVDALFTDYSHRLLEPGEEPEQAVRTRDVQARIVTDLSWTVTQLTGSALTEPLIAFDWCA